MKKTTRICFFVAFIGIVLATVWFRLAPDYYLPSEERVREKFARHRDDYIAFITLLRKDPSATFIGIDGGVDIDGIHKRIVPAYRDIIHKIGAKDVIIREDGSIEFALWGHGSVITSDSYTGVRYYPKDHKTDARPGWTQVAVDSLETARLPQEKGSVASGLYVVPIEPEWFVYRLEYRQ